MAPVPEEATCAIVGGGPAGVVLGLLLARVTGVRYQGPDGAGELHAELTAGCDGRWSVVRRDAGLPGLSVVPAYFVGVGFRPEHAPHCARR